MATNAAKGAGRQLASSRGSISYMKVSRLLSGSEPQGRTDRGVEVHRQIHRHMGSDKKITGC